MKSSLLAAVLGGIVALNGCVSSPHEMSMTGKKMPGPEAFYLPNEEASRVVSVTPTGPAAASLVVQTHRAAVKETGPKETLARFGEVYAFSPAVFMVHRDEPTQIRFWNLQPDDLHTFMLADPQSNVLLNLALPAVQETSYVFTFHKEGLFNFFCGMHQPGMRGEILVLPPRAP
jgi:plastocyanin